MSFSSDVLRIFSPTTVKDSCVFGLAGFGSFSDCSFAIAWSTFDRLVKKFLELSGYLLDVACLIWRDVLANA